MGRQHRRFSGFQIVAGTLGRLTNGKVDVTVFIRRDDFKTSARHHSLPFLAVAIAVVTAARTATPVGRSFVTAAEEGFAGQIDSALAVDFDAFDHDFIADVDTSSTFSTRSMAS